MGSNVDGTTMSDARKTVEEWPQTDIENKPEVWDSPVKSAGCEPALSPHDKDVITGPDQDLTEELLTDLLKTLPLSCRCGR